MKELFEYKKEIFSDEDLIANLKALGIKKGDILCVHTELFNFGKALGKKKDFLSALLDCFYKVLGKDGVLIMPTFTYSFCENKIYDKLNSRSTMGALNEFFRKTKGVLRTNDPIFSFAIGGGALKDDFMQESSSCFGVNSVYDLLAKNEGKILLFGAEILANTFMHYAEECAQVSFRFHKEFKGIIKDEKGKEEEKSINYFVRHLDRQSVPSLEKLVSFLKSKNNFSSTSFAGGKIVKIEAKQFLEDMLLLMQENENALLEDF